MEIETYLEQDHAEFYQWALSLCDYHREQAEDILQDVYIAVLEGRIPMDAVENKKLWLFGVIRNQMRNEKKKWALRRILEQDFINEFHSRRSIPSAPDDTYVQNQAIREFIKKTQALSPKQREVMQLVFLHDFTIEEVAQITGDKVGTVKTHYKRGKKNLVKKGV